MAIANVFPKKAGEYSTTFNIFVSPSVKKNATVVANVSTSFSEEDSFLVPLLSTLCDLVAHHVGETFFTFC
jgi:hypothetical protein